MQVAIVGHYPLDSKRIHGGVEAAFAYLVNGLRQFRDLQIHVFSDRLKADKTVQEGVTVHRLPAPPRYEFARRYRIYQSYLDDVLARIRPDVVHAQGLDYNGYVTVRSGYPAVITVHGVSREDSKYTIGNPISRLLAQFKSRFIERHTLSNTFHIIAISRYITDYYAASLRPGTQIHYIPNAIDEKYFGLSDSGTGHIILYAGRVMQRKRPLDLVRAFAQMAEALPQVQLRLAGEYATEPACVQSIRDFLEEAGLNERVHLLGQLSEVAILREFATCDVLALPSAQETSPMVIAQAMAAGKPVVATRVGGVPEMVYDGETGFLTEVGDIAGLTGALLGLLRDPGLRTRMGQAGKRFAEEEYRAASVAKRTYEVYQKVMATRRR